nr:receptor-like serine/threonine-protein kinase sd1-8 [Quercus suber]
MNDTWLPGMKLGWDLRTGLERRLTAWKSPDDPSPGELSFGIEHHNYPELVMKRGSKMFFRTGPWNGLGFSGVPEVRGIPYFNFSFFSNKDEVYFIFDQHSVISRAVLNQTQYERYIWNDGKWIRYLHFPRDECDTYNLCGVYGNCVIDESPICQCIQGFKPKSAKTWIPDEWSKGCVRSTQLSCQDKEKIGFVKFVGYKLPDTTYSWVNQSMNLDECRVKCLNNCSCMAYSNSDIRDGPDGGSGCVVWYWDLIDFKPIADYRQQVYIRMPASEQVKGKQKMKVIVIVVAAFALVFGVLLIRYGLCKTTSLRDEMENNMMIDQNIEDQSEDLGVPFFSLATIAIATNNFSSTNKLGEGGFGLVYKKNRGSFRPSHGQNLVGNAWKLWKEGKPLELIDTCLEDSCILLEIVRCLRISFLCLQQHPEDRPNMSSVVMMLHGESSLPEPKEPASFVEKESSSSSKNQFYSSNEITVTQLEAR